MRTENGYLLSYIKYGDHDVVLHCYTQSEGFQSFFVKGLYAPKNRKRALLSPLNLLKLTISHHSRNALAQATSLELVASSFAETDVFTSTVLFFVADFLNQILQKESPENSLFVDIEVLLKELHSKNYRAHYVFLFVLLKKLGYSPLLGEGSFLNVEKGIFEDSASGSLFDATISSLWRAIVSADNPYLIKIEKPIRKALLDSLLLYYRYHFAGFKTPVSLEIVREIFE